jgi:hypothetical protein
VQWPPYKSAAQLPSEHPHCLYRVVAHVMSQKEIKHLIDSGALN